MSEDFDLNSINIDDWGKKPKPVKKTSKKAEKSEIIKEENSVESSDKPNNAKITKPNPLEEQIKQLTNQLTNLQTEITTLKSQTQNLVTKDNLIAFIQTEGSESLKNWLFGNPNLPKGKKPYTHKNEINFLLNLVNNFLFKKQTQEK